MKIDYKRNCSGGAYWEIKYDNGTTASILGIKEMQHIINNAKEPVELMESLGF